MPCKPTNVLSIVLLKVKKQEGQLYIGLSRINSLIPISTFASTAHILIMHASLSCISLLYTKNEHFKI